MSSIYRKRRAAGADSRAGDAPGQVLGPLGVKLAAGPLRRGLALEVSGVLLPALDKAAEPLLEEGAERGVAQRAGVQKRLARGEGGERVHEVPRRRGPV